MIQGPNAGCNQLLKASRMLHGFGNINGAKVTANVLADLLKGQILFKGAGCADLSDFRAKV